MKAIHGWGRQVVVAVALLFMTTTAWSAHSGYHKVVDGGAIVPAEMVRGHPREHPESEMHGGVVRQPACRWRICRSACSI